ncbi:MAG TPA: glycosyltransferase [Myxococcales bacterium]|nr:glycosyltransferase [Myxococcales bacterium]
MEEAFAARGQVTMLPGQSPGSPAPIRGKSGGVLQLSMRRIHDLVAFSLPYELEDVVAEVTGADRLLPENYGRVELVRRVYKLARLATRSRRLANAIVPRIGDRLGRDYDLFFPIFNNPYELFTLAVAPGWRERCRRAACFIAEIWSCDIPNYLVELLAEFDHVFLGVSHPVQEIARIVGRPCTYLPLAADVLRFAPHPDPPARVIDVCNIGRRSTVTHVALLERAREGRLFYYYDTARASGDGGKQLTFRVNDPSEHRLLLANLLKRSRFYVANRSRVNEPEIVAGQEEISSRFYEGIAAGAVLVGEAPRSDEFRRQFDWPDAVIRLPFDSPDAPAILEAIDADLRRVARIRRENVRQAALRHDWVHRLRVVFETLGIKPTEAMLAREERLRALAATEQPAARRAGG